MKSIRLFKMSQKIVWSRVPTRLFFVHFGANESDSKTTGNLAVFKRTSPRLVWLILERKLIIYWRESLQLFHILSYPIAVSFKNSLITQAKFSLCVAIFVPVHTIERLATIKWRENNRILSSLFARHGVIPRISLNWIRYSQGKGKK